MKTVFDQTTREALISRINILHENSVAQWGKMTVFQMVKHCVLWEQMALGKQQYKRAFIGRLFGKIALRMVLKDEKPLQRNTPTLPEFRITGAGDLAAEKEKWIVLIREYAHIGNLQIIHPFFGKMTKEQIGYIAYKHIDHHLRQFNS